MPDAITAAAPTNGAEQKLIQYRLDQLFAEVRATRESVEHWQEAYDVRIRNLETAQTELSTQVKYLTGFQAVFTLVGSTIAGWFGKTS